MTPPLLRIEDLHVTFSTRRGPVEALRGVSFDVEAGETLGIVGESGSGKSVTAFATTRLLDRAGRITKGRILFDVATARACRRASSAPCTAPRSRWCSRTRAAP